MASSLTQWKVDLLSLNSQLEHRVRNMESWRDQQHGMFLNVIEMTARQVKNNARTMERMAESLRTYANALQDEMHAFRSRVNSQNH